MRPCIWITLITEGLNLNLLRLALASDQWDLEFSEKFPESNEDWEGLTHLVIDDSRVKSPRDFFRQLKPRPNLKRIVFLCRSLKNQAAGMAPFPHTFLTKPIDPKALKDIIVQDLKAHEPST